MPVCQCASMHVCNRLVPTSFHLYHNNCNFILITRFLLPDTCCLILVTQCDQCCPGNSASHHSDQNMSGVLVDFYRTTVPKIMEDIKIDMKCLSNQSLSKTAIVELRRCSDMYHYVDTLISKMLRYVPLGWYFELSNNARIQVWN